MTLGCRTSPIAAAATFPPAYLQFVSLYNTGAFWHSHEVLEQPWRANGSEFYKGLIIFASAFVHVQRGNVTGVRKQMAKVLHYMPPYGPAYMGLHVNDLLRHAQLCHLRATAYADIQGKAVALLTPRYRFVLSTNYVRGDEPELTGQ